MAARFGLNSGIARSVRNNRPVRSGVRTAKSIGSGLQGRQALDSMMGSARRHPYKAAFGGAIVGGALMHANRGNRGSMGSSGTTGLKPRSSGGYA